MRLAYHFNMTVSNIDIDLISPDPSALRGAKGRTQRAILEAATEALQSGQTPSVSELADMAEVSRATAYRYFPTQSDLIMAVIRQMLEPILSWESDLTDPAERVEDLMRSSLPRLDQFVATSRAALRHALDPKWDDPDQKIERSRRGFRVQLIERALGDLKNRLSRANFDRLVSGIAMVYGVEAQVVQSDICKRTPEESQSACIWAARAMVEQAIRDEGVSDAG